MDNTIALIAGLTALVTAIGVMLGTLVSFLKMMKELKLNTQLTSHAVVTGESTHRILTRETEANSETD